MLRRIADELRDHMLFTALGAATGVIVMVIIIFGNIPSQVSQTVFYIFHPLHIVLSALATTAMYKKYGNDKIWIAILIGYTGSIGIATFSDAIIPYLGGALLGAEMEFEVPFIETSLMPVIGIPTWLLVNPAAIIGIIIGCWRPTTKSPHLGHVLLSTWASLFYFTAFGVANWVPLLPLIFLVLFLGVWIPCCLSDIVFPLLFIRKKLPLQNI